MRTMKRMLTVCLAALLLALTLIPSLAVDEKLYSEEFYWDKAGEDADNGYKAYEIPYGSPLKIPEDPERYGSTFLGWKDWYTDEFVDLSTQIMDAPGRRFYAAWQAVTYTSRFYVFDALWTTVENIPGEPFCHPRTPLIEGYTFDGWDPKLPEIAPAEELEFHAVMKKNTYTSTFYVNGALWATVENIPGESFIQPRLPSIEGCNFVGWDPKTPAIAPAEDLEFNAVFEPCTYIATLLVDGVVYKEIPYVYGQKSIDLPTVPKKPGYSGAWESYSLVIGGVTINAIYTQETYIATLLVDGAVYMQIPYVYGQKSIDLPEVPDKPGYTGAWEPYSLVIGGVTIHAIYTPKKYIATLIVDGAVYGEIGYTYGQKSVALPEVPKKEGYTGMWGPYSLVIGGTKIEAIYSPIDNTAKTVDGDADGDGGVDLKDVVLLMRSLAGGWNARVCTANMDVNGDGVINLKDVTLIRRYLAGGWNVTL